MNRAPEQCVILVGGLGTRLAELTATTPKPLLKVGDRPFLEFLLREAARFGFRRILLLAGWRGEQVEAYLETSGAVRALGLEISVAVESEPAGTGGALWLARDALDEWFYLVNGDSWFDFNWLALLTVDGAVAATATMALRSTKHPERYGAVETNGSLVRRFRERPSATLGPSQVNAGVYFVSRRIVEQLSARCSLERDGFAKLASAGLLRAGVYPGRFIDIGVPEDYAGAQSLIPTWPTRPAVFLDRDGTINEDTGYVHTTEGFRWLPGATSALRRLNDAGYYVFVVTNQAGVARGFYDEAQVVALHAWMQSKLRVAGAHIDDFRYCPHHPDGVVEAYRGQHAWRKPSPGMLLDLMQAWPIDVERSVMIGDQLSDIDAGRAAGVRPILVGAGGLAGAVSELLGTSAG
jgi:D-glycero-D-manno-heptose 1,7-bisphosphate phosphatase